MPGTEQLEAPPVEQPVDDAAPQPEPQEQVDPQAELLEQEPVEQTPAPQPTNPEVLALIERQQQIIEGLQRGPQQPEAPALSLTDELKQAGMDEGTVKLFQKFTEIYDKHNKGKFLEREYGGLLHDVAQNTYEGKAVAEVRRSMNATDAEINGIQPHLAAVRKKYGANMPLEAAHKLALVEMRGGKTAPGLSAARQNKQDGLKQMTPPIKGGSAKLVPDKLSQADYDKLSDFQKTAYLSGLDPAKYADL